MKGVKIVAVHVAPLLMQGCPLVEPDVYGTCTRIEADLSEGECSLWKEILNRYCCRYG